MVVGVGTGASGWLQGLNGIQSTYAPRIVATSYSDFAGTVSAKGGDDPTYLKGAITATPIPSQQVFWNDPAVQKCVRIIKKAYPSTVIGNPIGAPANAPTTWVAAENTCQDVAIFLRHRQGGRKEPHRPNFQASGLWPSRRVHSRNGWSGLIRTGSSLCTRTGLPGDVQLERRNKWSLRASRRTGDHGDPERPTARTGKGGNGPQ